VVVVFPLSSSSMLLWLLVLVVVVDVAAAAHAAVYQDRACKHVCACMLIRVYAHTDTPPVHVYMDMLVCVHVEI
jgi:hypothetical protein